MDILVHLETMYAMRQYAMHHKHVHALEEKNLKLQKQVA
jgi:hypothetical protein